MFKLVESATYWWPVQIRVPAADDPGKFETSTFQVQYRYLDDEAHQALVDEAAKENLIDRVLVPRIVSSFREVQDANGAELAFSAAALERLAKQPMAAAAIVREYWASRKQAAEKN